MKRAGLALFVALGGCGDRLEHVAWPELGPEIRSIVLVLDRGDASVELSAHAPARVRKLELDETSSVWLLGYAEPIERIGEGRLDPTRADLGCFLSFPQRVFHFSPASSGFIETTLGPTEQMRLAGGRNCLGCLDFEEARIDLEAMDATLGLRLLDGSALVQITTEAGGSLVQVERSGDFQPVQGCEGREYQTGVVGTAGELWLGTADGRLDRLVVDPETHRCMVSSSTQSPALEGTPRGALRSLGIGEFDGRPAVYTASDSGRLEVFEPETGWTLLGQLAAEPSDTPHAASVAVLGPDEVIMSFGGNQLLSWQRARGPMIRDLDLGPPLDVSRPAWISALGVWAGQVLVGDSEGRISRWSGGGSVEPLLLPAELGEVGFIAPRGAGLVAVAESGRVLQINDGAEPCPSAYTISGSFRSVPRGVFLEPDGSMFVADAVQAAGVALAVWLRPR